MSKGLTARAGNATGHGEAVRVPPRRPARGSRARPERGARPGAARVRRLRERLRAEHGQAITELAIVLPVLLLILLGILDFGRAVNDWNDETHVANLAARYAAVGSLPTYGKCGTNTLGSGATLTQFIDCEVGIDSQALQNGSNGGNGPTPVTATICVPTNTQFQPVTVSVTTSYQWIPYLGITTTTSPVTGSATQEIEDPSGVPSAWINSTSC